MIPSLRWRENRVLCTSTQNLWQRQAFVQGQPEDAGRGTSLEENTRPKLRWTKTGGHQVKHQERRHVQLPNFPEPRTSLPKLVSSSCSLLRPIQTLRVQVQSCDSYFPFLVSKLGWVLQLLGIYLRLSGHVFLSRKGRTAYLSPLSWGTSFRLELKFSH